MSDETFENYFVITDPAWEPEPGTDSDLPPIEAVVGVWPVAPDGSVGRFRPNPDYFPTDVDSPTDPLDALLRLTAAGTADAGQLQLILRQSLFDIAMNGDGRPILQPSPDDVLCVLLASSGSHRRDLNLPLWRRCDLEALVTLLADDVDVLVNPSGPAMTRLSGGFVRAAFMASDDELTAAFDRASNHKVALVPWEAS
ncbi:type VII secretion system-associated protein [Couchioplanes caeruleus]|uniref:type VII secretion system-associated protein n=1 Tax=Couchioplanes caeruleus TaxID=56438 RepID=UPI0020C011C2|nr:type VII secretion system-associated protein [Couchioplanes caeruleus]UQU64519.1 type VII secretion system-associated protein [Couchioplanes caeruleus]